MPTTRHLVGLTCAVLLAITGLRLGTGGGQAQAQSPTTSTPPNVIVILTDDQGYGDLGSYGHPTIRTPHLDGMAAEGQRWTSFYGAPVCTPSRAQLLTGRLAGRTGLVGGVLFPESPGGLQPEEVTIAEVLKARGYATAAIGKWHLGRASKYLPTNQGFDSYYGIPYSNDMDRDMKAGYDVLFRQYMEPKIEYFKVPLLKNEEEVERPADQTTITRRYTDEAIAFIRKNQAKPFFVYLAHSMPHMPLFRSKEFEGHSPRGLYGDVIEELDANVGRIVATLRELKLDRKTLVVFLSDNGPWAPYKEQGGSAGLLRGAKGSNWEGGVRVPAIFWWPGTVQKSVVTEMGSELDLLPTLAKLTGGAVPTDRPIDGVDLSETLLHGGASPRKELFYYDAKLVAVRQGPFKLWLPGRQRPAPGSGGSPSAGSATPSPAELYNLDEDPSEKFDLAKQRFDVVERLQKLANDHEANFTFAPSQLRGGPFPVPGTGGDD